jgi:hypothetical protein
MTLADMTLEEKIRVLPNDLQREVEDFVEFLIAKQRRAELERTAIAQPGKNRSFIAKNLNPHPGAPFSPEHDDNHPPLLPPG